jgi:hypothetical protein
VIDAHASSYDPRMSYQVYATDTDAPPHSRGIGESITHVPRPRGVVHAVHAGSEHTMCGLSIEGLYVFPMHVWESFGIADGACEQCSAAIAADE